MKKWLKRIGLAVAVVLVGLLAFTGWSWHMFQGTPDWYITPALTAEEREAAANRADQKLLAAWSWASEMQAEQTRQERSGTTAPASRPSNLRTVSFTEAELNASFQKWNKAENWETVYGHYFTDPVLVIHDGRIIIAGKLKELGAVASMHFEPEVNEQGQFHLKLVRMLGGRLPLPTSMFDKYRQRVTGGLERRLPLWQQQANIGTGGANDFAVKTAMGKLLLQVLNDEPAEPVIFLPTTNAGKVPVHLREIAVEDKSLTLSVEPLSAAERVMLLQRLREPYGTETALTH